MATTEASIPDPKATLHRYLIIGREALLWKLEGLSDYDMRRPLVPTGTNLLGLVKHVAAVGVGYFGECLGRPFPEPEPWYADDAPPNADMYATKDETRDDIFGFWDRAWKHADATIEALPLDTPGHVPWWGERADTSLHMLLVHMATETYRHAGHADILREQLDGTIGHRKANSNLPDGDEEFWSSYYATVEREAAAFRS
ncbi:MAG TPA: DinB family protein [Actinomycetes bacterium]|nr:DinB family protein [Actinomycetes bacterium]